MPSRVVRTAVVSLMLATIGACATRVVPPVVTVPRHPDFILPALPADASPALRAGVERGWQFLQGGDLRNAEREFGAALKAAPGSPAASTALGWVALARGDADQAVPRFEEALVAEAAFVSALVGRGQAFMALEREGEALSSFEAALRADPSLTDLQARVDVLRFRAVQDLLARATAATAAGRLDDARSAYGQALAASPDSAFLYRDLAGVERRAGRPVEAIERLRKAVALDPADARAWAVLGELLDEQGDLSGALAAFESARAADPSAVPAETLNRLRDRAAALTLPAPYQAIPERAQLSRAELAALIGVRLEPLVARAAQRQVVITDVRGHWAQPWITTVVRSSVMDTLPNYQFEPATTVRRGELARTVARVLSLIAQLRPQVARSWSGARVPVTDVAPTHLSYPAVSVAVASGVMPLVDGRFRLLDPVSGADALAVIARLEALAR